MIPPSARRWRARPARTAMDTRLGVSSPSCWVTHGSRSSAPVSARVYRRRGVGGALPGTRYPLRHGAWSASHGDTACGSVCPQKTRFRGERPPPRASPRASKTRFRGERCPPCPNSSVGALTVAAGALVTIVLPTYDGARFIDEAIAGWVAQNHAAWELIVVDDASTDDTPHRLRAWSEKDSRIRVVRHATNRKLPAALNTGFAGARGKYLTWSSDDN